ncbi:MAG: carbohydrate ABC transporter permease [Lachnospiraceae bacterium]|nr:carbohydrate ABC transporter permease [Lachnospiraceae bacterium]
MKRRARITMTVRYIILTIASILVLFPILWMISTSLKDTPEVMSGGVNWIPKKLTFDAYKRIFTDYPFFSYYKSSILITFCTVSVGVLFAIFAGYGATRFQFKGKGAFLSFLLVTQMFPSIMTLIPFYKLLKILGLSNSYKGIILVYISHTIPFCSWMMKGYFESIPTSLDESAMIDGGKRLQILFQIVAPLALPGIASTAIYSFIQTWNEFMFASILLNSEKLKTLPVGIGQMNGFYRIQYNDMMAACFVASVPILIIYILLQRYFISSLVAGAVKE